VSDVVGALATLVREPRAVGEVFNIGNSEEITILDLAEKVRAAAGSQSPITFVPYDEAYEAGFEDMPRRVPDLSKIHACVGYRPTLGLDAILQRVVAHTRETRLVADQR
jgi:UDP-glucose 4-epimerase